MSKQVVLPPSSVRDNESNLEADVRLVDGENALVTTIAGEIETSGTVVLVPPTDRRFITLSVSGTPQPIQFAGFNIKGINIKTSQDSNGRVRIGEEDLDTTNNYTILEPGESYGAEVQGTLNPIYILFDTGTTVATVHVAALGDEVTP